MGAKTMRKTGLAAALLLSMTFGAVAEDKVDVVVHGTAHQALFGISFNGPQGLAVGAAGEVQSTEDGGKTWKQSKVPTDLSLLAVHLDAARAVAVGQSGIAFIKSTGANWEKVDVGTDKRLFGVSANVAGVVAAVGEFGGLFVSEDGGRAWKQVTPDWSQYVAEAGVEPHLYGVDVSPEGAITIVGEFGLILRSVDKGATWSLRSRGEASLFAIDIRDDGNGYAVGQDGMIMKTWNHGDSWVCVDSGSRAILTGVWSSPSGHVTVSGMREGVVSSDDGTTWTRIDNPEVSTVWYVGVASPGEGGALMVGQAGRVIRVGS
jgi:photosystem II stability/assembly factor-like uncharacterized protein